MDEKNKTIDDLLEERRKVENRLNELNELYGFLLRIHEVVSSLGTIAAILVGANVGVLVLVSILLVSLVQTI